MSSASSNSSSQVSEETIKSKLAELNSQFDPAYAESLVKNVIGPINRRYFKSKFVGFDQLPMRNNPDKPLIYIGNHSGMAFPWDAMVFNATMFEREEFVFKNIVRALTAPALSQSNLMNPFLIGNFWPINGAVDARFSNFQTMMHYNDSNLLVYPEGVEGIGKGFNRKYQLQRFATSFVRMSIKHRTDVIPVVTVNGEYINPYVLSLPWLNHWSKKIGIPYIPVGFHTLLLIVLPWLFYYGLPAKLTYVMGNRISPYLMTDKSIDEITEEEIASIRDRIKQQVQQELNRAVAAYGSPRYSSGKVIGASFKDLLTILYYTPLGWPLLFREHHRRFKKQAGKPFTMHIGFWSGLKFLFRNPLTIAYYIPVLGWIPLLIKGYWGHRIRSKI